MNIHEGKVDTKMGNNVRNILGQTLPKLQFTVESC